ncbi:MAG: type II toxin-antitoxin system RatA family toxin [Methylococcaceae bacterium]|jgi:ribosome-associated toxin RatA of RatAB toxin-antitoxin module|nr:type II toxin-antitoxin system RatA family toxin [Methylococcaceae bacterium]
MPNISTSVCVTHSPMEMFSLVNDVRAYPSYIPMCSEVKLLEESPGKLKATITIAKSKVKLSFTTENTMEPGKFIRMRLVDGPFKKLNGIWRFEPSGDGGCTATFSLDFEFANGLLSMAFGGLFKEVTGSMVEAFCRQASRKYGSPA